MNQLILFCLLLLAVVLKALFVMNMNAGSSNYHPLLAFVI